MALQGFEQTAEEKAQAYEGQGQRLKGHVVVVTGGDSGIGQATAIACAMEGADVAISYHSDEEGAQSTAQQVRKARTKAFVDRLDQADPKAVETFFDRVRDQVGVPTILINNAGVDARGVNVKDMDVASWDRDLRVNLSGAFYCAHAFLQRFLEKHGSVADQNPPEDPRGWTRGAIINVSSVHETIPRAGASTYDVSKAGLQALMRTLSLELATERIRTANVAPGMVLTPFNQPAIEDEEARRKQVESIPVKRAALPDEIARAIVFLASDDASYIHGTTLVVDGGLMQNQGQGA